MSEEEEQSKKKEENAGAPAWVMTFADLMSLLMCFFVLLLAFSEMDILKYKQVAGSMSDAFGVQNEIKIKDIPKGTSIIAQEFSAGQPKRTAVNELRQITSSITKNTLDIYCDEGKSDQGEQRPADEMSQNEDRSAEVAQLLTLTVIAQSNAEKLSDGLKEEINDGSIEVQTLSTKVVLRIKEHGSFASGSAELKNEFIPIMAKIRMLMKDMEGIFHIEGHTDDIPISTARFRSNWDLSSARAASVAQELTRDGLINSNRFTVIGYAENRPLVPNTNGESRAKNRRVEIIIQQGKTWEEEKQQYYETDEYLNEQDQDNTEKIIDKMIKKADSEEMPRAFEFAPDEIF